MNIEIIQSGRVLRTYNHNGQVYAEAPETGEYEIRLTNTSPNRRMAVVSVDGNNVITGDTAGVEGSGYVLNAWQTVTIKGFLRGSSECARFTFSTAEGSYAAQTGRGTKNTGVIGVAVFDEKVKPLVFQPPIVIKEVHHHYRPVYRGLQSQTYTSTTLGNNDFLCSTGPVAANAAPSEDNDFLSYESQNLSRDTKGISQGTAPNVGTAYGRAEAFHTSTTTFERASSNPALVLTVRYGVRAKLAEWGVPMDVVQTAPNAFPASPASYGYAQPPAGWRG